MGLSIHTQGSPLLIQVAADVLDPTDPTVQGLIDDMIVTVKQANGVGLAAPQVGVSVKLMIIASRPNLRYPHAPSLDPFAVINPRILATSDEKVWEWEGCLSVPNQRGLVHRAQAVVVEYETQQGNTVVSEWVDFVARIFQHEHDHLMGTLFLDRNPQRLLSEDQFQSQILGLT